MTTRPWLSEVKIGRRRLRAGDACRVKLPGKTQFRQGFTFKGFDPSAQKYVVRDLERGHDRYADPDGVLPVPKRRGS